MMHMSGTIVVLAALLIVLLAGILVAARVAEARDRAAPPGGDRRPDKGEGPS